MSSFWQYIHQHMTEDALVIYWIFSAAIGALPMPTDHSSPFYDWFFKFSNTFAANIARVGASGAPKFSAAQPPPPPAPPAKP